ncbi:MAG: hypothetical protein M1831_003120 [Alyxoria varia]|nr:MAG: hypothetical protein M1831_003120 [Alyxoria varia]
MSQYIAFEYLPTELLSDILGSCPDIPSLLALASTCRTLHNAYQRRKIVYLEQATESQYGPLQDAIQLVTQNPSQGAHARRTVPLSIPLIKDVMRVGLVAARWEDIYPSKHWHENYENRRLLRPDERRSLRRALYRLWLYDEAFHTPTHCSRYTRMSPENLHNRALLLHNWSNIELAEVADASAMLRQVLRANVCPSNGIIAAKFRKRFPDTNHQLLFNVHLNYPPPNVPLFSPYTQSTITSQNPQASFETQYKHYAKYRPTAYHEPGCEGWGDDTDHYFVLEDMLKLSPKQILELKEHAVTKLQVQSYVSQHGGDWFHNNGQHFGQTMDFVLKERGVDAEDFANAMDDGLLGIAKDRTDTGYVEKLIEEQETG